MDLPDRRLADLAARQHGAVTVAQARSLGSTRARLRTLVGRGAWERRSSGVLVDRAAPRTWQQDLMVAALAIDGAASHRAAARQHRVDGLVTSTVLELSVVRGRRPRLDGVVVHRAATLSAEDLVVIEGIPTTSLARTLCDLGAVVDDDLVEQALDDALRRGASMRWIEATLERLHRPGPSGTGSLQRVLERPDRAGPLPDSVFERLVERTIAHLGVPPPQRQVPVPGPPARPVAVIDLAWPEAMVGIEAQSDQFHSGPRRGRRDRDRHNLLTSLGWRMVYAGWSDVRSPDRFTARVAAVLGVAA